MSKIFEAFQKQQKAIRQVVAKYRSNIADIDELTQDVFLTGFAIELREDVHAPEHLLLRIAKNLAIDETRRKINKTSESLEDSIDLSVYPDDRQISPEEMLDGRQKLLIFSEALASLSPELRRVFIMRRVEGLKYSQIATRLNLSKSTIEKRVVTAMAQCEAYIRKRGFDLEEFSGVSNRRSGAQMAPVAKLTKTPSAQRKTPAAKADNAMSKQRNR